MKNPRDFHAVPMFGDPVCGWSCESKSKPQYQVLGVFKTQEEASAVAGRKNALPDREVDERGRASRPNWIDD